MSFASAFASATQAASTMGGGPFHAATVWVPGTATLDDAGDITASGATVELSCKAQVTAPTTSMRDDPKFQEKDLRVIILADSITQAPTTAMRVTITTGPHPGTYALESVGLDTAGVGYTCRARPI